MVQTCVLFVRFFPLKKGLNFMSCIVVKWNVELMCLWLVGTDGLAGFSNGTVCWWL